MSIKYVGYGVAAALIAATSTYAQVAGNASGDNSLQKSAPAGAFSDAEAQELQEVVVTARRREEKAQDVPIPLSVLRGDALEAEGIHSIQDLQQKLPSIDVQVNSARQADFIVRGIGGTTLGNEALESSTGIYVDGVYLGRPGMAVSNLYDLEQVEFLRGPQGTLFGKNTTTGAFNFTTHKPTFVPEAEAELTYGSNSDIEFRGLVSGPLVGDQLAGRISVYKIDGNGFLDNLATGKHPISRDQQGLRAQLFALPNDNLTLRLIAEYNRDKYPQGVPSTYYTQTPNATFFKTLNLIKAAGYNITPVAYTPYDRDIISNTDGIQTSNQKSVTAQADWQLANDLNLTSISAFRGWDFTPHNDLDTTNLNIIPCCGVQSRQQQVSQELRVSTPKGETVESTAGLYYFWENQRAFSDVQYGTDPKLVGIWFFGNANSPLAPLYAGKQVTIDSNLTTDSYAAFAQSDWHLSDRLTLTGGLRETYEEKSIGLDRNLGGTPSTLPNNQSVAGDLSNWELGTNLAVTYKATEYLNIYASYGRGAKSGTLNNSPASNAVLSESSLVVKPEKINDVELGFKSDLLDKRLQLNGDAFYSLIQNYQTNVSSVDPTTGITRIQLSNAPWVVTKGVESDLSARIFTGFTLTATASYNDATYRSFHDASCPPEVVGAIVCNDTGRTLMGASRWKESLTGAYTQDLAPGAEGYLIASYSYRSSFYGTPDLSAYGQVKGYGVANLRLGLRLDDSAVDISLWARNLFDTNYYSSISTSVQGATFGFTGDPRTVGGRVTAKF